VLCILMSAATPDALAHGSLERIGADWNGEPWIVACFAASLALYVCGLVRLWRRAGLGRGVTPVRVLCFVAGWLAAAVALLSPLDAVAADLFCAHMAQHELLMVVAAPLMVLGRPIATWTWAMPRGWRRPAGVLTRMTAFAIVWRTLTAPSCAWLLHAAALWVWHWPRLFDAALASGAIHTLQHLSFLLSALLFWWATLGRTRAAVPAGAAMVYLFTTMMHTSALGALLSFAGKPWYPAYYPTTSSWGLTPLEDQQMGGLIMWIPGGAIYAIAALALIAAALAGREREHWAVGSAPAGASPEVPQLSRSPQPSQLSELPELPQLPQAVRTG
jgi:putative membrane protein